MTALIDITGQTFGNWKVIKRSNQPNVYTFWECRCKCGKIKNVAKNGRQIQMSVYYYLDTKLKLSSGFIYLPNSPWLLIVLPYAVVWGDDYVKRFCNSKVKEVLSIGICQPYEKGNFI